MGNENVIPLDEAVRSAVECQMALARVQFGDNNIEIMAIAGSWGETMMIVRSWMLYAS